MDLERIPYLGEALALGSPLCWSFAVILFRRTGEIVPAVALNLFKVSFALCFFVLSYQIAYRVAPELGRPEGVEAWHLALLLVSGAIGIGLADTLFLMCLNRVGAGRQAIINTSYSPPIILLSAIFLGERLTVPQLLGVALILGAVLTVGRTRSGKPGEEGKLMSGVLFGVAGCLSQAVSIVMVKPFMDDWPVLWMTTWRLFGGLLAILVLLGLRPGERRRLVALRDRRAWPHMIPASFLGTYLALLMWMGGFKYTEASVASALNQTATLFTFALAVLLLHEPVTRRRLGGLGLGVLGVALVTFAG
jgi:drug/metabolite transporter (DMT)-like permease